MSITLQEAAAEILTQAADLLSERPGKPVLIAIDGRCGSGKSTLGEYLQKTAGAQLLHMDDYYLRPEQRTRERYETPGENVDHERFLEEVMEPLSRGEEGLYRAFRFHEKRFLEGVRVKPEGLIVIEGSYSFHPSLSRFYDLRYFLDSSKEVQKARIIRRGGEEAWISFRDRWIPLEELYFANCAVREQADSVFMLEDE